MKKIIQVYIILIIILLASCNTQITNNDENESQISNIKLIFAGKEVTPGSYLLDAIISPNELEQDFKFQIIGSHVGVSITDNKILLITEEAKDNAKFKIVVIANQNNKVRDLVELRIINDIDERIKIRTEDDLLMINESLENLNKDYLLMNDIVLTKPWDPIGVADLENEDGTVTKGTYFNGTFNGNGFTISNINIKGNIYNAGFIAQIGANGILENIKLEGKVNASGWSAGVAGINEGIIRNVISNIDVIVSGVSAGAITAVNKGIIEYSYAIGKVFAESVTNDNPRSSGLVVVNEGEINEVFGDFELMETNNYISFEPIKNFDYMIDSESMKRVSTWINFDQSIWLIKNNEYPHLINPLE